MTDKLTLVAYAAATFAIVWWLTRHHVAAVANSIKGSSTTSVRVVVHNLERVATSTDCRLQINLVDGQAQSGLPEPLRIYAGPGSRTTFGVKYITEGDSAKPFAIGVEVNNLVIPARETIMLEWGVTQQADAFVITMTNGSTEIFQMRVPSVDLATLARKADAISRVGMEARPTWSAFAWSLFLAAAGGALLLAFGSDVSCVPTKFHVVCADGENVLRQIFDAPPWWAWTVPFALFLAAVVGFHGIRRSGSTVAQGYLWDQPTLQAYSTPKPMPQFAPVPSAFGPNLSPDASKPAADA